MMNIDETRKYSNYRVTGAPVTFFIYCRPVALRLGSLYWLNFKCFLDIQQCGYEFSDNYCTKRSSVTAKVYPPSHTSIRAYRKTDHWLHPKLTP